MGKGIAIKYSDDMKKFISDNQYGISRKELADRFNTEFGTSLTTDNMQQYCIRNNLKNGFNGRFVKGQKAFNKGVPMDTSVYKKVALTMFKKGNVPVNHKPVGSERISKDGYIEIKVSEPNKWRLKHNVIWEQENGPIPKSSVVVFLDQNKMNVAINNLKLIERKDLLVMNRNGLFCENAKLTELGTNVAKLINATNSKRKEKKTWMRR